MPEGVFYLTQKGKTFLCLRWLFLYIYNFFGKRISFSHVLNGPNCRLHGSTTVETAATSTATAVRATSWPCPPTLDLCECATCATHSCCREARPLRPDKATQRWTHSSSIFLTFLKLNDRASTESHLIWSRCLNSSGNFRHHLNWGLLYWPEIQGLPSIFVH